MIKVKLYGVVATVQDNSSPTEVWTCEERPSLAVALNEVCAWRPRTYEHRREVAIARYIVERYKDAGAEIIYDSELEKLRQPKPETDYIDM